LESTGDSAVESKLSELMRVIYLESCFDSIDVFQPIK